MKDNSCIAVIDGDTPIFRHSKILEETYIEVWWNNRVKEFENITRFKGGKLKGQEIEGYLNKINKGREEPFSIEEFEIINKSRLIKPPQKGARLDIAKRNLRSYISDFYAIPWVKEIKYCVGGNTNFRYEVDKNYKSNRGPKPLKLLEVKEWFCDEFKDIIVVADNCEADDKLSQMGHWSRNYFKNPKDSNIVLCGYDKDLLQIYNNWHFNFDKRDEIVWINEFTGHKNLALQCLKGDTVDGIKGLPEITPEIKEKYNVGLGGCAEGKANKILDLCETIEDLYREVEWCYRSYYKDDYKQALNKEYMLVKLLEKKDEFNIEFPFQL